MKLPSGRVHETVNLLTLPAAVYFLPDQLPKIPFAAGYLVGTFWLTPDLDLTTSRPARRWGILRIFWLPYAWLFTHRGLSHRPFLGALTRVLYLAALAGIGLFLLDLLGYKLQFEISLSDGWLSFFAGVLVADAIHLVLDTVFRSK
ncbi:MAG: metal-binding protein [Armatimonadetes bacterium]|nr:metal-binding protein [Armatimonadota bacterium]